MSSFSTPTSSQEFSKNADSLFITNPPKQHPGQLGPRIISPLFPHNRGYSPPFAHSYETRSCRPQAMEVSRLVKPDEMSPAVTLNMLKMTEIMYGRPVDAHIHEKAKFGMNLRVRDLRTYIGNGWLEDITINFYLELIKARNNSDGSSLPKVFVFHAEIIKMYIESGFRYHDVIDKTADPDEIFDYDLLLFPIHTMSHWSLICVDMIRKTVCGYDSLGKNLAEYNRHIFRYVQNEYVKLRRRESETIQNENIPPEGRKYPAKRGDFFIDWRLGNVSTPQQENCNDCGVFILQFAEYLSRRKPFNFGQAHMPYFRRRMAYETLTSQLLESSRSTRHSESSSSDTSGY